MPSITPRAATARCLIAFVLSSFFIVPIRLFAQESRLPGAVCPEGDTTCTRRPLTITDSVNAAYCDGVVGYKAITYRNTLDGMVVPAYLWEPLDKRGPRGHAAMIWVHGGVHGQWGSGLLLFIREAVQRGYVIVTPDYRGSTGYGKDHYLAIDYGGREIDDVESAVAYLKTLPYVDPDRIGMMGWSHGGFIAAHVAVRKQPAVKASAAIVPVTNLLFRLSYKGPGYRRSYAAESTIVGLPFEK